MRANVRPEMLSIYDAHKGSVFDDESSPLTQVGLLKEEGRYSGARFRCIKGRSRSGGESICPSTSHSCSVHVSGPARRNVPLRRSHEGLLQGFSLLAQMGTFCLQRRGSAGSGRLKLLSSPPAGPGNRHEAPVENIAQRNQLEEAMRGTGKTAPFLRSRASP